ncbi:geranylgeranyl pyrophosphate synthase-like isoform X2 [Zerene cesonia]|uniref:geranylgeranyl pyrophosphate synthase-like isoform X2 n=1 Tax=Zerene cesonia TaxID=33412 RepID=UPI0018E51B1B|nr:geranylgeranyl pyrophosphate synthase-like isoform X2 [Zerene cesonia]
MNNKNENRVEEPYMEKELLLPYTHLMKIRSKQLRKKIPMSFNHWLKLPAEKAQFIVDTVDMLHNGTLLIDDIQDNTLLRRSIPAAHLVYGIPLTLNTSLHVIFLMLDKLLTLNHPNLMKLYCEDFLEIIRGQGIEVYWRDNFQIPTEAQYENMLKQKTGHMFRLAVRVMQLFSDFKHDLSELPLLVGLFFQLRDDYCNLLQEEAVEEWPADNGENCKQAPSTDPDNFCEDLTEGKFTLPIIHAANTGNGQTVLNILRQRTRDVSIKKFCVSELERLGSLKYTRDRLEQVEKLLRAEITRLGGNPMLTSALDDLAWK